MPFHSLWEAAGAIGAGLSGVGYYLWRRGSLKEWRQRMKVNGDRDIGNALERIEAQNDRAFDKLEDVEGDVEQIDHKLDSVADTVYYLHEDDDRITDRATLADSLDVDPADDFMRGGQDD